MAIEESDLCCYPHLPLLFEVKAIVGNPHPGLGCNPSIALSCVDGEGQKGHTVRVRMRVNIGPEEGIPSTQAVDAKNRSISGIATDGW